MVIINRKILCGPYVELVSLVFVISLSVIVPNLTMP